MYSAQRISEYPFNVQLIVLRWIHMNMSSTKTCLLCKHRTSVALWLHHRSVGEMKHIYIYKLKGHHFNSSAYKLRNCNVYCAIHAVLQQCLLIVKLVSTFFVLSTNFMVDYFSLFPDCLMKALVYGKEGFAYLARVLVILLKTLLQDEIAEVSSAMDCIVHLCKYFPPDVRPCMQATHKR